VLRALGWELDGDILILLCCYCIRNQSRLLVFFLPLEVGHLKLHAVDDVDLSHSMGIDCGCAGYESEYDNNADGWYDWGMRRFAQGRLWREE
jgi:hypothetical protein